MGQETVRPVYVVYPGLYPLLMFNYWVSRARVPIVGVILSGFDTKYQGRILPFFKEFVFFIRRSGWRYTIYMLLVAKLGVPIISFWNFLRRVMMKKVKIKTFTEVAQERGIPLFVSDDFNGRATINFIKNINANLIVSAYNNQILKPKVFNVPKYKAINIHPGYLPDFRGLDAPFENLYHKVKEAGVTIHYVNKGIDSGRIIIQEHLRVRENDTLFSLNVRLWMHGAKMLQKVFDMIGENEIISHRQRLDKAKYPYRSYPRKERVDEFVKGGGRFIKWKDITNIFK